MTALQGKPMRMWELPRVYLAGGINGLSDLEAWGWREDAETKFLKVIAINPKDLGDHRGIEDADASGIVARDLAALRFAHAVLVNVCTAGCGTAMEMVYANLWGIPIVGYQPDDRPISPWVRHHCKVIVQDLTSACAIVTKMLGVDTNAE